MGSEVHKEEEKKEEEKKEEVKVEEKKEEAKKEEEPQQIVLKVDMHCEACARKVARSLKGFQGVEDVTTDCKASKVVVKGKTADPTKVCERIRRKTGRKVDLISPLPKPPEQIKEEEKKEEPKEDKKEEKPPAVITVILNVQMHCEACAQLLQRRIRKIQGVESVTTDLPNDKVIVKGILNPAKLVEDVYKKTRKQVTVVKEEKKEEEKKEEEKKEEKEGEKKEEDDKKSDIKRSEYFPSRPYMEYHQYAYAPEIFSDENPNACFVM